MIIGAYFASTEWYKSCISVYNKYSLERKRGKNMILYYTGTGNSEYVAKKIGDYVGDELVNLFEKLRNKDYSTMVSKKSWVIVAPTYAWQLPHIVRDWLLKTKLRGNNKIYFVLTCGNGIGNAGVYAEKLCEEKEMTYMGTAKVVMPENYIAAFDVPEKEEIIQIVKKAQASIKITAEIINAGVYNDICKPNLVDKVLSDIVNEGFYKFYIKADKFYATEECVSCGKCETVCPYANIKLVDGKPVWGKECTHCMACICKCPQEAIEYGDTSKGKRRCVFPMKRA